MSLSYKARFLAEQKLAKQFLDVVDSEAFARATELAMLALIGELPANASMDWIKGADRFLEILRNLPEPTKTLAAKPSYNLQHDLK